MPSRGYAAIGLHYPKNVINVGSVLRAVHAFGARLVVVEGQRYRRVPTDTTQAAKHVPLLHGRLQEMVPFDCVPVAVDLVTSAQSLHGYVHPQRAFYVFGPEDSTLGEGTLRWCRDVIYVPTNGCLNLAACVNVVLYDRSKKMQRQERLLDVTKRDGWKKLAQTGAVDANTKSAEDH